MSIAVLPNAPPSPRILKLTCEQFHAMSEAGRFEGRRAMLIDGLIWEQGPMNPPHAIGLELLVEALRAIFGSGWRVRIQLPLELSLHTDPHPDVAIVRGNPRDSTTHPATAALVVEVSDSTIDFDLGEKANLYAAAGIADYWVLDLVGRQLHIFRDPSPGATFLRHESLGAGDRAEPLAAPGAFVSVSDLLP